MENHERKAEKRWFLVRKFVHSLCKNDREKQLKMADFVGKMYTLLTQKWKKWRGKKLIFRQNQMRQNNGKSSIFGGKIHTLFMRKSRRKTVENCWFSYKKKREKGVKLPVFGENNKSQSCHNYLGDCGRADIGIVWQFFARPWHVSCCAILWLYSSTIDYYYL